MINMIMNTNVIIGLSIGAFLFIVTGIAYIMYRDRKNDQEEINDIISNLVEPKVNNSYQEEEVVAVENKTEIEKMIEKMQRDIDAKPEEVVASAVANFEQEQEEKSIISYHELLNTLKSPTTDKEEIVAPIVEKIEQPKYEEVVEIKEEKIPKKTSESIKKFKNTDFISPIYGKMDEHLEYPTVPNFEPKEQVKFDFDSYFSNDDIDYMNIENDNYNIDNYLEELSFDNNIKIDSLEQTLNMKPISAEIKKNDEFLNALKEFRKNLQ